jgi:hypothetical protein
MDRQPIPPDALLTDRQVQDYYGLSPGTLLRWVKLRRIKLVRMQLRRGQTGSPWRFIAGDIVKAVEAIRYREGGDHRDDPMMG